MVSSAAHWIQSLKGGTNRIKTVFATYTSASLLIASSSSFLFFFFFFRYVNNNCYYCILVVVYIYIYTYKSIIYRSLSWYCISYLIPCSTNYILYFDSSSEFIEKPVQIRRCLFKLCINT